MVTPLIAFSNGHWLHKQRVRTSVIEACEIVCWSYRVRTIRQFSKTWFNGGGATTDEGVR